jgi:mannose-1-phosphate guanylyltransferase
MMNGGIQKAFLLAAGLGTRLRPLTESVPKCLLPINGKPLLSIWLEICNNLGLREVLINVHHFAGHVEAWAHEQKTRVQILLSHEPQLLGSAGTVAANRAFVGDEDFFVFYADNLVGADLKALKLFHRTHSGVVTLGLFRTSQPESCGIVTLDPTGRITSFEEKPTRPKSGIANAGVYIARREIFDWIPALPVCDFGKDVFPHLVDRMWGMLLDGYLLDIGTPENYQKALREWPGTGSMTGANRE